MINMSDAERMLTAFLDYRFDSKNFTPLLVMIYCEGKGFCPLGVLGVDSEDELEDALREFLDDDEFVLENSKQRIISIPENKYEDSIFEYDGFSNNLKKLFGHLFANYRDVVEFHYYLQYKKMTIDEIQPKLLAAREELFKTIFGDNEDLPKDLGMTEHSISFSAISEMK